LSNFQGNIDLERMANDAMQNDFPDRFSSREEWEAYNEEQDRRDRNKDAYGIKDI
jgi:hypothetical protein